MAQIPILAMMGAHAGRDNNNPERSDEELARLYRETGDRRYAGTLYQRFGHLVLGLCFRYLRNRMDAEDAAMQVFTGIMTDLRKHEVRHFKSWLYVYSKNFCLMELRKRQVRLKRELEISEDPVMVMDFASDAHLNERERQILLLEQAIETLNENQRTCIRLFYLQNLSYAEIAQSTGLNGNEVKSHIQNGKRNLKMKLEAGNNAG